MRPLRVGLELLAELADHRRAGTGRRRRRPRPGASAAVGQHLAGVLHEQAEDVVLRGVRSTRRSPSRTMRRTRSTREVAGAEDRLLALLLQPVAQRGADAGDELLHAERLGHVVVGAEVERLDDAGLVGAARQDDDRRSRGPPRASARITSRPAMSGRPRSSRTRSGVRARWRRSAARPSPLRRRRSPACRGRCAAGGGSAARRRRRGCGRGAAVMPRRPPASEAAAGKRDGEDRAGPVGPVGGGDRAAHGLDEAAADREAEAGPGADAGRPCCTR